MSLLVPDKAHKEDSFMERTIHAWLHEQLWQFATLHVDISGVLYWLMSVYMRPKHNIQW